jgi:hypothetical protein
MAIPMIHLKIRAYLTQFTRYVAYPLSTRHVEELMEIA